MDAIVVEALVKRFGSIEAVGGISFSVKPGELFGFLGPNGAGKTTTINILCTLLVPTSGRAMVNGYDVVRQPSQVRSSIGLVFQDPSLDEYLNAVENLRFYAACYHVPRKLADQRIEELLRLVELWDRKNSLVRTYSGGMKRRLEIARGLLHRPQTLFLDEPTLGLDPQSRKHIWQYLHRLREKEGATLFLTTHYMEEAEQCDRVAIIDHGKIVAIGPPEALKSEVGGDVITLQVKDQEAACRILKERFEVSPEAQNGELRLNVQNGSSLLPEVIRALGDSVRSVTIRRPSLEDVFLKYTGHRLRDEEAQPADQMRLRRRVWRGR